MTFCVLIHSSYEILIYFAFYRALHALYSSIWEIIKSFFITILEHEVLIKGNFPNMKYLKIITVRFLPKVNWGVTRTRLNENTIPRLKVSDRRVSLVWTEDFISPFGFPTTFQSCSFEKIVISLTSKDLPFTLYLSQEYVKEGL